MIFTVSGVSFSCCRTNCGCGINLRIFSGQKFCLWIFSVELVMAMVQIIAQQVSAQKLAEKIEVISNLWHICTCVTDWCHKKYRSIENQIEYDLLKTHFYYLVIFQSKARFSNFLGNIDSTKAFIVLLITWEFSETVEVILHKHGMNTSLNIYTNFTIHRLKAN